MRTANDEVQGLSRDHDRELSRGSADAKDIIQAAHQQITRRWWAGRDRFDIFVSRAVVAEARRGDAKAAARRLGVLRGIPRLAGGRRGARLAEALLRSGALPRKAEIDAVHVGIAAVNGIDYLLTWNLRHLANAAMRGKIRRQFGKLGSSPRSSAHRKS